MFEKKYIMRRFIVSFAGLILLSYNLFSATVPYEQATEVAKNIFYERSGQPMVPSTPYVLSENGPSLIYVINNTTGNGFVMISADDAAYPVLGYSLTGHFTNDTTQQPPALRSLIRYYKNQILWLIDNNIPANNNANRAWNHYSATPFVANTTLLAVPPLLGTIAWGQGCYYNADCPYDAGAGTSYCNHVPVGCVAVAMAQIMKYWTYPSSGTGANSYTHPTYGTQSANFSSASYNWSLMPNSVTSSNTDVAQIMYHCGVAVDMNYGPTGSGAYASDAAWALVNNFNYSSSAQYLLKSYYTNSVWENMLKTEFDNSRPVFYRGNASNGSGGHAFVLDGYQGTSNNHFHINWGWDGYYNGYFYLSSLTPGSNNFSYDQGAIFNIEPSTPQMPSADFTADNTFVSTGSPVNFSDLSSGIPTSWSWTFNGGTPSSSNLQNPGNIVYNTPGTYSVSLTATNSVGSDIETKNGYITVTPYCIPYTQACDEYFSNVSVGSINNTSGCSTYSDFTNISTNMLIGNSYPITLTNGTHYSGDAMGCWIDWNGDYDFDDPGESISITYNNGVGTGIITVPANAQTGQTTMRLRIVYQQTPNPCDSSQWGEVEDYSILVISGTAPPIADFHASSTTVSLGQSVNFTDISIGAPTGWSWDFGDSQSSALQNPAHTYTNTGLYTVSLVATNAYGSDTMTKTDYINVVNYTGCDTITNLLANDTITYYTWTGYWGRLPGHNYYNMSGYADLFTNTTPKHLQGVDIAIGQAYAGSSSSYITVNVWDKNSSGLPGSIIYSKQLLINTLTPSSWNYILFDSAVYVSADYFVGVELNYGTPQDSVSFYMAQLRGSANTMYINLGGWDDLPGIFSNTSYNSSLALYVVHCPIVITPPVANFSYQPAMPLTGQSISFTDLSTGSPTTWLWDFGNSQTSALQNPSYTYSSPGTYNVCLIAANSGGSDTTCQNITITNPPPPVASFNYTPTAPQTGQPISFTDLSAGSPTSWLWDFGNSITSAVQNPNYTYPAGGTYHVCLTVSNAYGTDSTCQYITVANPPPPTAGFSATPVSTTIGQQIQFTDHSTDAPTSWTWYFGDGNSSTQQHPSYSYGAIGTYSVKLVVSNAYGSDSLTQTNYITISGSVPTVDFSATPTIAYTGDTIWFTDLSSGSPTSWNWQFGDATTSTQQHPFHIYSTTGSYTVELSATNIYGTSNNQKPNYIYITNPPPPPVADFTANTNSILAGQNVSFTNLSSGNPTAFAWQFDGGTPSSSNQQNPGSITYYTPGIYDVTLIVSNTIGTDTTTKPNYITVGNPGIEEAAKGKLSLYPVPVNDWLSIEGEECHLVKNIIIYDMTGREVITYSSFDREEGKINLNTTSLSSGIFIIKLEMENNQTILNFCKI